MRWKTRDQCFKALLDGKIKDAKRYYEQYFSSTSFKPVRLEGFSIDKLFAGEFIYQTLKTTHAIKKKIDAATSRALAIACDYGCYPAFEAYIISLIHSHMRQLGVKEEISGEVDPKFVTIQLTTALSDCRDIQKTYGAPANLFAARIYNHLAQRIPRRSAEFEKKRDKALQAAQDNIASERSQLVIDMWHLDIQPDAARITLRQQTSSELEHLVMH